MFETLVKDTQTLPTPRAQVFATLVDWTRYADWNPYIVRIDGQPQVGQAIRVFFSMGFGPAMPLSCRVTTVDPSKTMLAWDYKAFIPWLYTARHSFTVEDSPGGQSLVIQTEDIKGLMASSLFRIFHKLLQRRFQAMHAALRKRVAHAAA
ncbi:MAG TPA: SRPBCC domain-containing protein [Oligoflexus sp.]|uniref:SRPBCC domain-containing protein n=1 Tax=Oligoflexus sp. TaxID=1971216 RepID=UPI002D7EFAF6|nr:SRPBCC domain-containing protein [Oligoflexus sp.]HET9237274.1 SRPBCC domain-containing protein [Oligoflexus sp.]